MNPEEPEPPERSRRWGRGIGGGALALAASLASPAVGQAPPDSTQLADSAVVADSVALTDSLPGQVADSVSADTIFYNLPRLRDRIPEGFATGIWAWDRHAIMASGANTLAELFEEIPGLVPLYGGDYGTPLSMSAFGRGAAAYRIFRDGFEVYPVSGGVVDLQHVGLAGIHEVRLDRSSGQMLVELRSLRYDDGRPFSVVQAGTGDLDTNMFRGVYADPTALGGSVAVGLERVDTRGIGASGTEGGNRSATWARYQYHFGDRAGLALDYRTGGSQTQVQQYAPDGSRTDLMLRAGWRPWEGVVVQAATGRSSLDRQATVDEGVTRVGGSRRQHVGRIGVRRGRFWIDGTYRHFEGGLPTRRFDVAGGGTSRRWGGVSGAISSGSWRGEGATNLGARVWLHPVPWVTLFGQYETGGYGAREGPIRDGPPRPPLAPDGGAPGSAVITEREGLRVGGTLSRWGVTLGGAALYVDADRVAPLGVELDTGAPPAAGAQRYGYESMAVLPMPLDGLTLEGSYQRWGEEGPYLPKQIYRGSFQFHRVFLDSGNLELWASLGVRGHDPMLTFAPATEEEDARIARVPFFQVWYAHAQVRVVTVRLWIGMENMTLRRNLQTYPERRLPFARTFFALRWDMWN